MDKSASPERGRAQLLDDIRNEIASSVEASEIMTTEPDLSEIWHGEAFASLPPAEQHTLIAWAEEKGWPTPEAPPGYESEFATASDDVTTEVAAETSTEFPQKNTPDGARDETSAPVSDAPSAGATERREEKRERPKTWLFREYRTATSKEGNLIIEEDRKRWSDDKGKYDEQDIPTSIVIPQKIRKMIERDSSAADDLIAFCNETRGKLDVDGVKVFFDRPRRNPGKLYAKWKYSIGDAVFQDKIELDELPEELVKIVRDDLQYYKTKNWNDWYGLAMQQKREAVISAELGKRYGAEPEAAKDAARPEKKPAAPSQPGPDFVPRTEGLSEGELHAILARRADLVAQQFERLISLPADADKFVEHVVGFTGSLYAHDFNQNLSKETVSAIVREALCNRYQSRPDVLAAITVAMPEKTPAAASHDAVITNAPENDDEEAFDIKDEQPEPRLTEKMPSVTPEMHVEASRRASEKTIAETYGSLRGEMARLSTVEALDTYVQTIEAIAKSGRPDAVAGAKRLLSDIDDGLAGPLSEERKTDFVRPDEEIKFFKKHPSLDGRNFRVDYEGRVVAMVELADEEASLHRAMRRVVDDAFSTNRINDAEVAERITGFTVGIVTGRNKNEQMRKSFTEKLAMLDKEKSELVLKNLDELGLTLAGLAEQLLKAKKG